MTVLARDDISALTLHLPEKEGEALSAIQGQPTRVDLQRVHAQACEWRLIDGAGANVRITHDRHRQHGAMPIAIVLPRHSGEQTIVVGCFRRAESPLKAKPVERIAIKLDVEPAPNRPAERSAFSFGTNAPK